MSEGCSPEAYRDCGLWAEIKRLREENSFIISRIKPNGEFEIAFLDAYLDHFRTMKECMVAKDAEIKRLSEIQEVGPNAISVGGKTFLSIDVDEDRLEQLAAKDDRIQQLRETLENLRRYGLDRDAEIAAKDSLNNDLMANCNQLRDRCWKAEGELAIWQEMYHAICADRHHKRRCARCGEFKTFNEFSKDATQSTGHGRYCLVCKKEYSLDLSHRNKTRRPYKEAHDSTLFLGVHIAETVLQNYFDGIVKMPMHNPGYDFICKNGFKIDVKSSCRRSNPAKNGSDYWRFHTDKNVIADYFLCLAFDNRENLEPQHVWLIPSSIPSARTSIVIVESKLSKWAEYEKDIEKAKNGCDVLRRGVKNGEM